MENETGTNIPEAYVPSAETEGTVPQPEQAAEPAPFTDSPAEFTEPEAAEPVPAEIPAAEAAEPVPDEIPAAEEAVPAPDEIPAAEEAVPVPNGIPAEEEIVPVPGEIPAAEEIVPPEVKAKKKKQKTIMIVILSVIAAALIAAFIMIGVAFHDSRSSGSSSSSSSSYVDPFVTIVKTAENSNYGITYGAAFNSFFGNPRWDSFIADSGEIVVEFTGTCSYDGSPADVEVQFVIDLDEGTLQVYYMSINGVSLNRLEMAVVVKTIFESY